MFRRKDSRIRLLTLLFFLSCILPTDAFAAGSAFFNGKVANSIAPQYRRYYDDTVAGLEAMRSTSGLVNDKITLSKAGCRFVNTVPFTSPTNIAIDLLVQLNRMSSGSAIAAKNLGAVIHSLEQLPFNPDTGLFYSWYKTTVPTVVRSKDISSVDNIHLALALWTIHEQLLEADLGKRAQALFTRMDFSKFYDQPRGLFGGNLRHRINGNQESEWTLDTYRYSYFGSESRSVYALAYALDLLKSVHDQDYVEKTVNAMKAEIYDWNDAAPVKDRATTSKSRKVLRTWDGGAFQMLLPEILIGESRISAPLKDMFKNYSEFVLAQQLQNHYPVPAGFSACSFELDIAQNPPDIPVYNGHAGSTQLVSTDNRDLSVPLNRELWDMVSTPHAVFLAALARPNRYALYFQQMERFTSGTTPLYCKNYGFQDGYFLKGGYAGHISPVQLSLDQGMIALSLEQMFATDGRTVSARALWKNAHVHDRLVTYYASLDQKLNALTPHAKR